MEVGRVFVLQEIETKLRERLLILEVLGVCIHSNRKKKQDKDEHVATNLKD